MAEIYRARTFDADGRPYVVAIKRVLDHLAADDDFIQMLIDEAKIASALRHPNIARIYEFTRAHGEYFIAMEHVDGKDTRAIVDRGRERREPIPPIHAAYIGAEVAAALQAAHTAVDAAGRSLRIVHRDVSPSNILVSYAGDVKLCDFGIAKATLSEAHTRSGVIKGKLRYMSPEQALGHPLDRRSDLFSLGCCLYEMTTGAPAFHAASEFELLLSVRDGRYRPVLELAPTAPPALAEVIDRCMARAAADRYQTAAQVETALRAAVHRQVPTYSRSHLRHYIGQLFAVEIERELQTLNEYHLAPAISDDVGENLIALGTDDVPAESKGFQPHPGGNATVVLDDADLLDGAPSTAGSARDDLHSAGSARDDLHSAPTQILDPRRPPLRAGRTH